MTENRVVETYKGHDIILTETLRFAMTWGAEDSITKETAEGIRAVINDRIKAEAKSVRLDIQVLTDKGDKATVTGIHMGTSEMIGTGLDKGRSFEHSVVYPVAPWIQGALAERERLRDALDAVETRLESVAISLSRGYGRVDAGEVALKIADFHEEYNAAYDKAHETTDGDQPL